MLETPSIIKKEVIVCRGRTCSASSSAVVFKAFKSYKIANVNITSCNCLGQCGNGPMVLILPEEIWYDQVSPPKVKIIVEQHLLLNKPIKSMFYRQKHPLEKEEKIPKNGWSINLPFIIIFFLVFSFISALFLLTS